MASHRPRARRHLLLWICVLGGFGVVLLLVGWTRVVSSPSFCGTCHDMDEHVTSAAASVHADVPCLACHTSPGVGGAIRYIPAFLREVADTATGWDAADHVMPAAQCSECHEGHRFSPAGSRDVADDAEAGGGLEGTGAAPPETEPPPEMPAGAGASDCASCHGKVAHVVEDPPPTEPHPDRYDQTHGRDAVAEPASCTKCHQPVFCQACHFRESFPHGEGWTTQHGREVYASGAERCALCHARTFCAGCHGTEIPHAPTWLTEHYRSITEESSSTCMVCHPPPDCTSCHARHDVHNTQRLYRMR